MRLRGVLLSLFFVVFFITFFVYYNFLQFPMSVLELIGVSLVWAAISMLPLCISLYFGYKVLESNPKKILYQCPLVTLVVSLGIFVIFFVLSLFMKGGHPPASGIVLLFGIPVVLALLILSFITSVALYFFHDKLKIIVSVLLAILLLINLVPIISTGGCVKGDWSCLANQAANGDLSLCRFAGYEQNNCVNRAITIMAVEAKNSAICKQLTNEQGYWNCLAGYAYETGDTSVCDEITSAEFKRQTSCYEVG